MSEFWCKRNWMKAMELQQNDKFKHMIAGYLIVALLSWFNPFVGFLVCLVVGYSKEVLWDKKLKKGQYEIADMVWTWIGGLMALVPQVMYLIKL